MPSSVNCCLQLLVWGLGNDSPFWSQTTSGTVVFLEDGSWSTNLLDGKRWFDYITAANPQLEAYAIDYTTKNSKASYDRFYGHPESWNALEIENFPKVLWETRWDVILVDAPLGVPNKGPGRYQSLYVTNLLAKSSEAMPRSSDAHSTSSAVHVFVDDYERKVERTFSQHVFGKTPVKVVKRVKDGIVPANEQAHFIFGQAAVNEPSILPPHSAPESWVILLSVNDGYYDFFLNWLIHYNKLDIAIIVVVIAEDDSVEEKLKTYVLPVSPNVRVERSRLALDLSAFTFNTENYKQLVSERATHILQKLEEGIHVIYTDVDTVWRLSPLPYLSAAGEVDAIMQVERTSKDGHRPYYCTGFMALVSNERTIQLMSDWQKALKDSPQQNQPIFHKILHTKSAVKHQPLPIANFPNGLMYFTEFNDDQREKVVVVHNNFIRGHDRKKERFEQTGLWKEMEQKK
jgi:Nucleotide-diphospho-sugar transferase/Polysaccharide biosynthesis